jgi:hypothetical protein
MSDQQNQASPRRGSRQRDDQDTQEAPAGRGNASRAQRPVRTIRMGRVRAAIWANHTESGVLYNTTFERIYKPDGEEQWKSSDSFGPNDLLLLAKVANEAHTWVLRQRGMDDVY